MDLTAGQYIGPYEIVSPLGAGGMGEVYRAHDAKLKRDVALKILPAHLSRDVERLGRFEREARVLASLNHPHIATIYGVDESDGVRALILELVEGPTLAERLGGGPMPVPEALSAARQIAEALDAAHEKGIVHRDLKPANIKVTPDGIVKVLDFGIAKMRAPDEAAVEASTVTTVGTRAGALLGTAAYMSPEQARGQPVDKRGDIWAFGCVLYEMLTGRAAFAGETVSDTVARVLEHEPAWDRLPPATPPQVRRLLHRCLEKTPKERLRDIGDARVDLDERSGIAPELRRTGLLGSRRAMALWAAIAVVVTAAGAGAIGWVLKPTSTPVVSRFSHVLDQDLLFTDVSRSLVAVAPDGSAVVYTVGNRLYRRALNQLDAYPIRGTDGRPSAPFFSPDGQTLGYWDRAAGELRRIAVGGGTPVSLTPATALYGANWERDGTIVYGQHDGIWRVSANGGERQQLVRIEANEFVYGPRMLPDGRRVLFSLVKRDGMVGQPTAWDTARVVVQTLQTGERREVTRGGDPRIVPSGHLVYALGSVLFAVPFDLERLEVRGAPTPMIENVQRGVRGSVGQGGSANYDVSSNGTLVYVPDFALAAGVPRRLLAVDLSGNSVPLIDDERDFWRPRISPDGGRVAVEVVQPNFSPQVWIVDLEHRTLNPVAGSETSYSVWTPDGKSVIYRRGEGQLFRQPTDGGSGAQVLADSPGSTFRVMDVSRDGVVAVAKGSPQDDIQTFDLGTGVMSDFLATPAREYMASFSPDGRWLAYTSNESGRDEVYVRPFPRTEGVARLVSMGGGSGAVWAPNGSALYYRGASGDMMAVPMTLAPTFTSSGRPRKLFRFAGVYRMSGTATAYDIHPDGKRFIMVSERKDAAAPRQQVNIVLNWFEELRRLEPAPR
jgi:eukaryotic-like serine/threonine-protein kinase